MMAQLAALQARVAQLEVELSLMPSAEPRAPSGRLLQAVSGFFHQAEAVAEECSYPLERGTPHPLVR